MSSLWTLAGDADPEIVVGGESHRRALWLAIDEHQRHDLTRAVLVSQRQSEQPGGANDWADYWPDFAALAVGRTAVVVWSGNQNVTYFLFEQGMEISLGGPFEYRPASSSGTFVTERALRALLLPSIEPMGGVLDALVPVAKLVLVVGTPPPSMESVTRQKFQGNKQQAEKMARQGVDVATVPLQPDGQRVALWWLLQEMMCEVAEAHGATWVPVSPRAYDENGFLRPELARDGSHGNGAFGALMWDEIALAVKGARNE